MRPRPTDRRGSIRHALRVPLRIEEPRELRRLRLTVAEVSTEGMSFALPRRLPEGTRLKVTLPIADRLFAMIGSVVRCAAGDDAKSYRVGITFTEPSPTFRTRLETQAIRITELQKKLSRTAGREVPLEEAARQWVTLSAERFADLYGGGAGDRRGRGPGAQTRRSSRILSDS